MVKIVKIAGPVSRFLPASAKASVGRPASAKCAAVPLEAKRSGVGIPSTTATRVDWNLGIGNWSLMNGGVK